MHRHSIGAHFRTFFGRHLALIVWFEAFCFWALAEWAEQASPMGDTHVLGVRASTAHRDERKPNRGKAMSNIYGLPRDIPADTKRLVRQRCGFGCVVCGLGIVQYEHVDPEYKDAHKHDPDAIALLCPQCHARVTTKMWSKARVKLAMKQPKCKQVGYTRDFFDLCGGHPSLQFGGVLLSNCPTPIEVGGHPLFSVKPPEEEGGPFRLSGLFTDSYGMVSLQIEDNEWRASSKAWDVEVKGPRITIREGKGDIHLVLRADPPQCLVVERLNMSIAGMRFEADGDFLRVHTPNGGTMDFTKSVMDNCRVGMSFN
jgi:hypothetical protein